MGMDKLKLLVIDVDGTMTDAGIYYDENGNEIKKFCTKDAVGFFAAHKAGIKIMVLTGRKCNATARRMKELKVEYLFQDVKDKKQHLEDFMKLNNIQRDEVGYLGDDLNDLPAMTLAGYIGCPADSCSEIKGIANFVSSKNGGAGAVRDIIENILRKTGQWENIISNMYIKGGI
ncbi:MAG: hypothetical protein DBX37_05660 [Massilioclostridium sp.]|nr:MAG: hypothetical protein DBX37_05660 [Massilioclostridium sp.]